jgi:hypothetical protein
MPLSEEDVAELNSAVEVATTKPADEPSAQSTSEPEVVVATDTSTGSPAGEVNDATVKDVQAAPTPAAATPVISDAAIMRAVRAGLSLDDARSFASDAMLDRVVASIESVKGQNKPVEEEVKEETDPFAELPKLNPEEYEPEVVAMFDKLVGLIKDQHNALRNIQATSKSVEADRATKFAEETEAWFDGQVEALGEDFKESLGTGKYRSLQPNSPQYAKRDAIANQVAVLMAGYRSSGQTPQRDAVFAQAAQLVLRDEYQKLYEKRLSADLANRSTQHLSRVGSQQGKSKGDPIAEVAAMLDEKFFGKS